MSKEFDRRLKKGQKRGRKIIQNREINPNHPSSQPHTSKKKKKK